MSEFEYEATNDWRVGDRAYISGEPTTDTLVRGDIVYVRHVDIDGKPKGHGLYLHPNNRQPLRLIRPGELVEAGTKTAFILADCSLGDVKTVGFEFQHHDYNAPTVLISKPKPAEPVEASDAEKLERVARLARELVGVIDGE